MRNAALFILVFAMVFLTGCGGVSQSDYDTLKAELEKTQKTAEQAEQEAAVLQGSLKAAQKELEDTKQELTSIQEEYREYQEKMAPFEDLSEQEAEARKITAQKELDAAKAEEEAKAAEEAAEQERKAKQGYDTGITYEQLARTPDLYEGEKVKFKGEVVQVTEDTEEDEIQIRLALDDYYENILFCGYDKSITSRRVLEGDVIAIYGLSVGLISYESTGSGLITIPAVYVEKIEQ